MTIPCSQAPISPLRFSGACSPASELPELVPNSDRIAISFRASDGPILATLLMGGLLGVFALRRHSLLLITSAPSMERSFRQGAERVCD